MYLSVRVTPRDIFALCAVYRPPPSQKNGLKFDTFMQEFSTLIESTASSECSTILVGDFNIHVDDVHNRESKVFLDMLEDAGLEQHVTSPTHEAGHILDIVLSDKTSNLVTNVDLKSGLPSDHKAILMVLKFQRPQAQKKFIRGRKLCEINRDDFRSDIMSSSLQQYCSEDPSLLADKFCNLMRELLDKHAPERTILVSLRPSAPWFNDEVREAKRHRRRAERKWMKSRLEIHSQLYRNQCCSYNQLLMQSKSHYLTSTIEQCDTKQLFRFVKKLTAPASEHILPDHSSDVQLANDFGQFFHQKVQGIVSSLGGDCNLADSSSPCNYSFNGFDVVSEATVQRTIKESPSKSCRLDPIPTTLLKDSIHEVVPFITKLINQSLCTGIVPSAFKTSLVTPG